MAAAAKVGFQAVGNLVRTAVPFLKNRLGRQTAKTTTPQQSPLIMPSSSTRNIRDLASAPSQFSGVTLGQAARPAAQATAPAAQAARGSLARLFTTPRGLATTAAGTTAGFAPEILSFVENKISEANPDKPAYEAPDSVRRAAEAARIASFLTAGGALARGAMRTASTAGKVARGTGSFVSTALGVNEIPSFIGRIRTSAAAAPMVEETPVAPTPAAAVAPVQTRYEEIQGILDQSVSDAEAEAAAEDTALDQLYADAYQKAIAAAAPATAASAASDPVLQQELALINQSYANAKQQNAANYAAALDQVSQYQAQADQLLQQLAAEQVAGLQTATGQLVAPALGTGLTPEQAAAAGLSQTAVGGAGTTGSALLGALGGVQAAQSAAGRLGTGLTLTEQLASGRLDQAALEAALGQAALEAERVARVQGAERAFATAESTRQANLAQAELALREIEGRRGEARDRRQALARARQDKNQSLVNLLAGMTDAEYRTMRGGTTTTTSPEWATKRYPVPNTKEGREKGVDAKAGIKGAPAVTVAQATNVLDALELQVQVIRQENQTEQLAQKTIQEWFAAAALAYPGVDVNAILKGQGIPTTTKALAQKAVQG